MHSRKAGEAFDEDALSFVENERRRGVRAGTGDSDFGDCRNENMEGSLTRHSHHECCTKHPQPKNQLAAVIGNCEDERRSSKSPGREATFFFFFSDLFSQHELGNSVVSGRNGGSECEICADERMHHAS